MAEGGTTPTTENTDLNKDDSVVNPIPQQRTMVQQKPLNVRQQDVPMRGMVTNIPKASDFLKKKTTDVKTPSSFLDVAPKDLGSRYSGKFTSKVGEVQKSADDVKNEIDAITNYKLDDGDDSDFGDGGGGVQSGGIDYSSVDRFSLDDDLRDVFNDFSKSQLSMFGVLTSNPIGLAVSGIGLELGKYTGGKSVQGAVANAELGKLKSTAFHQAALQIQKDYGLTRVSNINDWSIEAKNELARQGRVSMDFANDIFNASVGKPYEDYSFNEAEKKSFTEKAKDIMNSIRDFGKPKPSMLDTVKGAVDAANKQKSATNLFQNITSLAKDSLAKKAQAEKDLDDALTGDPLGDEDKTMQELTQLNFSNDAISDIEANGGVKEIRQNPNGTSYSVNVNGTFTHFDGTTVNFTDSKGNPGNAPKQDDTARQEQQEADERAREAVEQNRKEQEAREQRERDERAAREQREKDEKAAREQKEKEARQAADKARAEQARREQEQREQDERDAADERAREAVEQAQRDRDAREQRERDERAAREQREREQRERDQGNDNGGGNDGGGGGGGGGGSHICTATYDTGYISKNHFTVLKKYGIMLRKNDPYMMKAYDVFGPKIASLVNSNKYVTSFAKFLTNYYQNVMLNKPLSTKQKIFKLLSVAILRPTWRLIGRFM